MKKPFLSVVTPVYGAPDLLPLLYERLKAALEPWADFEIIMVNDACPQGSGEAAAELAARDERVKLIDLMRNYGQHVAISAGLDQARGDWVVVMDCDLQDPPEEIKKIYDHLQAGGFEAVFGSRLERRDSWFKHVRSRAFRLVINALSEGALKVREDTANFSVITRRVVLAYRRFKEKERLYGAIVSRIVSNIGVIAVEHAARPTGRSAYDLKKTIRLAFNAVISNSHRPLMLSIYCALGLFVLAFALGGKVFWDYLERGSPVMGWTSTMVVICFFFGLQMLFLGILGAYLGQIALESKGRPFYLTARTINLAGREDNTADGGNRL